jgi:hypothetical protein
MKATVPAVWPQAIGVTLRPHKHNSPRDEAGPSAWAEVRGPAPDKDGYSEVGHGMDSDLLKS